MRGTEAPGVGAHGDARTPRWPARFLVALAVVAAAACSTTSSAGDLAGPAFEVDAPVTTPPVESAPLATTTTTDAATSTTTTTTTTTAGDPTTTTTTSATTTTTPTPTTTTTTTTLPAARTISMAFTGDVLPHSPLWRQALRNTGGERYDFGPMLAGLAPLLEPTDLAVCHLETPIAPVGEDYSTAPIYGVPAEIVEAVALAGHDRCSTASNHTMDRGAAGIDRTVEVLASWGLDQSGMARTPDEIEPTVFRVADVAVSHLSYTFSYNGLRAPEGEEWRSATIDVARIVNDAGRARELGAELVVVSMHWGNEGVTAPSGAQLTQADELAASGLIDLVVGHHAHVLQPIEQVGDTWVVFGLGNILSNLPTSDWWPAASQDGAVVTVEATIGPDGAVTVHRPVVHPTWVDIEAGWIVRRVLDELADPAIPDGRRHRLEASLARTASVLGEFLPG